MERKMHSAAGKCALLSLSRLTARICHQEVRCSTAGDRWTVRKADVAVLIEASLDEDDRRQVTLVEPHWAVSKGGLVPTLRDPSQVMTMMAQVRVGLIGAHGADSTEGDEYVAAEISPIFTLPWVKSEARELGGGASG